MSKDEKIKQQEIQALSEAVDSLTAFIENQKKMIADLNRTIQELGGEGFIINQGDFKFPLNDDDKKSP